MKRHATAVWNGTGKEGKGVLSTQSGVLEHSPYTYNTRFESAAGTNPEELLAAAHAGCFSMKLSFVLNAAGFTPDEIQTECTISMDNGVITESALIVKAKVPGIDAVKFQDCADDAKENCPVSKAYSFPVTLEASLLS